MSDGIYLVLPSGKYFWQLVNWDNPDCQIINYLLDMNAKLYREERESLQGVVLKSSTWQKVIQNKTIQTMSGQNPPVLSEDKEARGLPERFKPAFTAKLVAAPWVNFYIDDTVTQ